MSDQSGLIDGVQFDKDDPATRLFIAANYWRERAEFHRAAKEQSERLLLECRQELNAAQIIAATETEIAERSERLLAAAAKLVNAVTTPEFGGIKHADVDGKNWFDARYDLNTALASKKATK